MSSRFCTRCKRAWPPNPDYAECPFCGVATEPQVDRACMASERAERLVASIEDAQRDFDLDWTAAEAIAAAHELDVADMLVAKRPREGA